MVKKNPSITVVLNAYKRISYLKLQINAITNQTIQPCEIILWKNFSGKKLKLPEDILNKITLIECSKNLGVWSRFSAALNSKSDFVCILDDDTIPGNKWFENCINSSAVCDGIFGTRGLRFYTKNRYDPNDFYGWQNPVEEIIEVDIIGHAWFFKRSYLSFFWRELPEIDQNLLVGEDIHFSYTIQKYANLKTYVPPHPEGVTDLWGSLPEYGNLLGIDNNSISNRVSSHKLFNESLKRYTKKGFILYYERNRNEKKGIIFGPGIKSLALVQGLSRKYPWLRYFGIRFINCLKKIKIHL
jgi:hypothetical protein